MTTEPATIIRLTVFGRPEQRGSKTPWLPRHKDGSLVMKNGRPVIATMDANKKSKAWMSQVRSAAGSEMLGTNLVTGPISLSIAFYFARPKSHFGSGKNASVLKLSAPAWHTQTPDVDKLVRCLTDSLSGIVFADDRQVCHVTASKHWTEQSERAEVVVSSIER